MEEAENTKKHDITPMFTKEILKSELDKFCTLTGITKDDVVLIKESAIVMHGKIDRCQRLKISLKSDDCKKLDPLRFKPNSTRNETVFKDIYGFTEVYCSFVPGDKPGTVKPNDELPESEDIDGYKVSPIKDAVIGICDDIYELKMKRLIRKIVPTYLTDTEIDKKKQLELLSISSKENLINIATQYAEVITEIEMPGQPDDAKAAAVTAIVDLATKCPSVDISKESDAVCISTNSECFGG